MLSLHAILKLHPNLILSLFFTANLNFLMSLQPTGSCLPLGCTAAGVDWWIQGLRPPPLPSLVPSFSMMLRILPLLLLLPSHCLPTAMAVGYPVSPWWLLADPWAPPRAHARNDLFSHTMKPPEETRRQSFLSYGHSVRAL